MIFLIRTHSGMAHESFLVKAVSFGEAEQIFKTKYFQDIDSIERVSYDDGVI